MRRLSQLVVALALVAAGDLLGQSPHGDALVIDRAKCHSPAGWNNQTQVNNDHNEGSGYSYNSAAYFNCNPNGN